MAIELGDNIKLGLGLPNDARYYNTTTNKPWTGVTEVNSALLGGVGGVRYSGLTVNIGGVEYWYKDGIGDGDLILKTTSGGGSAASGENVTKNVTQASHGFAVKDFIGWSGGTYNKAIANGLYDGEFVGLVTSASTNTFNVTQSGYITGLTGLVTDTTYFLSETTAGLLTDSAPTGDTQISKAVIVANSTTSGWVLPYAGYVVTSGSSGSGTVVDADNGLHLTPDGLCVAMGGTLTGDTVIDADQNCFSIINACEIILDATGSSATLTISAAGTIYEDSESKGICYAGNYDASGKPNMLTNASYVTGYTTCIVQASNLYTGETPSQIEVGGMAFGTQLTGKTYTQLFEEILVPELEGTVTAPSVGIGLSATGLYEIGCSLSQTVTGTFNQGCINPQYCSASDKRSGLPNAFCFVGTGMTAGFQACTSLVGSDATTFPVGIGTTSWSLCTRYDAGSPALSNKGNEYCAALVSGCSTSSNASVYGVYPLWATCDNITTPLEQVTPLYNMASATNICLELATETASNKQKFEVPCAWLGAPTSNPLVGVCLWNSVGGSWEYQGGSASASLTYWTCSSATETVQSNTVGYCQFTYNGPQRGTVCIRLVF